MEIFQSLYKKYNSAFRIFWKLNIFIYMDNKQYSPQLITLLNRLYKYNRYDSHEVLALRAPERAIFYEAAEEKGKMQREEFAKLIKGK